MMQTIITNNNYLSYIYDTRETRLTITKNI